jgi:DNA-3-methyladenine glycosylase II
MKEAIDHLTAVDPIFNSIIEKYGVPVIPERPQGLETLVLLILEQQVSIDSAKATFKIKGRDKNLRPYCTYGFIGSGI